jgi:hypothetical protein
VGTGFISNTLLLKHMPLPAQKALSFAPQQVSISTHSKAWPEMEQRQQSFS